MSLLQFLRVVDDILPLRLGRVSSRRSKRPLAIEALERRSVLALIESPLVDVLPPDVPIPVPTSEESPPVDPTPAPAEGPPPGGEDQPVIFDDPPPIGAPPVITSLVPLCESSWVRLTGTVVDADGPVEGLTVYFMLNGSATVAFTATVEADGTFTTAPQALPVGTLVSAYTIDVDGNYSNIATCTI